MMRHKLQNNNLGSPKLTTKLNKFMLINSTTNNYVSSDMHTNCVNIITIIIVETKSY